MKRYVTGIALTQGLLALSFDGQAQDGLRGMSNDWALLITHSTVTFLLLIVFLVLAGVIRNLSQNDRIIEMIKAKRQSLPVWLTIGMLGLSGAANAQISGGLNFQMTTDLTWVFILADVTLILFIFIEIFLIRRILRMASLETEKVAKAAEQSADWTFAGIKLTDNVPLDRESDVMTDHEYDGIRELDNNLPPWWVYGFYFTIFFAIVYIAYYHMGSGPSQAEEYVVEMNEAEEDVASYLAKLSNLVDENNVELLTDEASLAAGKEIYASSTCNTCHGDLGEGGVGPTFADQYWKHGGGIKEVFSTIKYGFPEKGMISWESQLSPGEMQQVASYILNQFPGTNPPGMKAPEGEIWEEATPAAPAETEEATSDEETADTEAETTEETGDSADN